MPQSAGITQLPYDAHLGYARRVGGTKTPATATSAKPRAETTREASPEPFAIDERLAHFMDAGRPQTRAMYPGPPPEALICDVWSMSGTLLHVRPVRLWNGLKERHPSILGCLKMLRHVLKERATIWKGRHGMFGE